MSTLTVHAPDGVPEVRPGDDLAALLLAALEPVDGDVVLVTSKVVSKAEGRTRPGHDRLAAIEAELAEPGARVVARRGATHDRPDPARADHGGGGRRRLERRAGHRAAPPGRDPGRYGERAAAGDRGPHRRQRRRGHHRHRRRAWRTGQTDIAIGAAGVRVLDDHAGRTDGYGNQLAVTAPALVDELAGAAGAGPGQALRPPLRAGPRPGRPWCSSPARTAPARSRWCGARVRTCSGYGAREAVVRALAGAPADREPFGSPAAADEVADAVHRVLGVPAEAVPGGLAVAADPRVAPLPSRTGGRRTRRAAAAKPDEKAVIRPATP